MSRKVLAPVISHSKRIRVNDERIAKILPHIFSHWLRIYIDVFFLIRFSRYSISLMSRYTT